MVDSLRHDADSLTIVPLAYQPDGEALFRGIRHLPQAAWLDSGYGQGFDDGRYDILCAQPTTLLTTEDEITTIRHAQGETHSRGNPFDLVEAELAKLPRVSDQDLPFTGGALGYFGYHLNRRLERLPTGPAPDVGLPAMQVGIYEWAVILDHQNRQARAVFLPIVGEPQRQEILALLASAPSSPQPDKPFKIKALKTECEAEYYQAAIAKIQDYIVNGDVYQVNFAQRFQAEFSGDLLQAYCRLRRLLPAPYSAFLLTGDGAILSHSPELFLRVNGDRVITKPIKGTRPRGRDPAGEAALIRELQASTKDRAENLMIVDLLRNDLGKHCIPGSIAVPALFELQTFANVHHLVSTVTGKLRPQSSPGQLLRDSFPGGSITGAPKIRAMEIISELEQLERSAYCGSIGYLSSNGRMATNIAIRTLVAQRERIYAWGGGGIVADSEVQAEYRECLDKIGILLDGLKNP